MWKQSLSEENETKKNSFLLYQSWGTANAEIQDDSTSDVNRELYHS